MRGLRPTATRISAASTALPSSSSTRDAGAVAADPLGLRAGADVDAVAARAAPRRPARRRTAPRGASRRSPPSIRVTLVAERGPGLRELGADRAAAEDDHARGDLLRGRRVAVVPGSTVSSPSIGGIAAPLPVATTTALRAISRSVADARRGARRRAGPRRGRARSRALPARAAGRSRRGRGSPRRGGRGPPAASSSPVTASATPGTRRASASSVAGAQQRLRGHAGVVGALAADQVLLDDRHRQPAVGEAPGADLARGPGAEHDRVELPFAQPVFLPDTVQSSAHSTGATGFDVVDPCERLQVEVAGGLVKPRHKPIRADHEFALAA